MKTEASVSTVEVLHQLHHRAISTLSVVELQFVIVNESYNLAPYRQAAFFDLAGPRPILEAASGLVSTEESSPYSVWLNHFAKQFVTDEPFMLLNFSEAAEEYQEGWHEWLPDYLLLVPLRARSGEAIATTLYAREHPWTEAEIAALRDIGQTYQFCLETLKGKPRATQRLLNNFLTRKGMQRAVIALVVVMLLPVRLSALAPAEVIALNAFSVAAPQDGAVASISIEPNAPVKKGDLLFSLDNTSINNRHEVALKALDVAKADALVAEQRAFDDMKGKADLATAMGRVQEKKAELAAVEALRNRIEVRAERDGIAVFGDANDWVGKPVQTGERIMQIANPQDAGILVWLPAQDALNLDAGAPIKLFLHTQPLSPIGAKLEQTSYQVSLSPENISSYRLKGRFDPEESLPRIGLRGTARVSGDWNVLFYYLFRRPIAALRANMGL